MSKSLLSTGRLTILVPMLWVALLAALPDGAAAEDAEDDGAVIQGTWSVTVTVETHLPDFGTESGTWTYRFGEGCTVGEACSLTTQTGDGSKPSRIDLDASSGGGFTRTIDAALDCLDQETGEVRTPHGADYHSVSRYEPTATEVRDGVTYITAMSGTLQEKVVINAAGRAEECYTSNGGFVATQRAVLTATAVPLPAPTPGTSSDPVGVDPATVATSGTIGEFTLPLSDTEAESRSAVASGRRSSVPGAVTVPSDALASLPARLPKDLLLVALVGLLMVFPAQVFNSTYEENHERLTRRFRRRRTARAAGPAGTAAPATVPGRTRRTALFLGCAAAGTALGGLLDPGFGANRATGALLGGVFVALVVAVLVAAAAGWVFRTARHQDHHWYLRAIPSALLVAVLCVLVSRLTHFEPGYLYGVLGGAVFAGALSTKTEGRAEAVTLTAGLAVSLGAWLAFEPVAAAANRSGASLAVLVGDSLLGSLFIGGIEGLLFSLVPLRFLPGYRVRQWGWVPWGVLTLTTAFVFVHVLLVPEAGYLGRSTSVSATVTLALFGAFGLASVLFWAWFRFRPDPAGRGGRHADPAVEPALPIEQPVVMAP